MAESYMFHSLQSCLIVEYQVKLQATGQCSHIRHRNRSAHWRLDSPLFLAQCGQELFSVGACQVEMVCNVVRRRLRQPLLGTEILELVGAEHLKHFDLLIANVLNVVGIVLRNDGYITGLVIECPRRASCSKDSNASFAANKEGPFVSIWMPVHLSKSTWYDRDMCSCDGLGDGKVCRIGDADFTAREL